jgi:predicted ATPase/class 3 adenylate cyclase
MQGPIGETRVEGSGPTYSPAVTQQQLRSRPALPTGTVTFLFSDIEGSTRLVGALGGGFTAVLERHQAILRETFEANGGVEVATEGDSFFVVFPSAADAIAGAVAAQRALAAEPWVAEVGDLRVRMGLHTGEGTLGGDNYAGMDVHRAARIAAAAHGGQVLVSAPTRSLTEASLPLGVQLRDLGAFRLKDLAQPERLVQLVIDGLRDTFPAPRTLETPTNLPPQVTSFIGRAREVAEISELIGRSRLVTLTGPGGTGKTRLSLRVADSLRAAYPDGVFFVELAPIMDPGLIPATIAQAIGLREDPARPVIESLEAHLRELQVLLVLDNFEQIVRGALVVGRLLEAAPRLTVLTSSREALHLRGEQEYPVPPLGVPDPRSLPPVAKLSEYDAVALFIQRAEAVKPDFAVTNENAPAVAEICARLDGLPLAIELAAARSKLFTPDAILARLGKRLSLLTGGARDSTDRQRTLRGAIDWSHDLLDPTEQTLFRRLSIFVGGSTIESAAAVCDADGDLGIDVIDGLSSFVDKSLLRTVEGDHGEPRFQMLETMREYGLEKLANSGDADAIRRRHEDHFLALALEAEPQLLGARQKDWLDRLDHERDNLRAALWRGADDGRIDAALEAGGALWRFWQQRGHLAEGREALQSLLDRPAAAAPTAARSKALAGLGGVIYWQGDIPAARPIYAAALAIQRELDDPAGLAEALFNAGYVAVLLGDRATARADYAESMNLYEQLGSEKDLIRLREAQVFLMHNEGEYASARALQRENVAAFRRAGETGRVAIAATLLAGIDLRLGEFAEAHASLADAVGIFHETGDMQGLVRISMIAAAMAIAEGDFERAALLSGAGAVLKEPLGEIATPLRMLQIEDPVPAARAGLGDTAFDAAFSAGRAMSLEAVVALVRA